MFPLVSDAVASIVPVERLRWITFGHVEADECGSMNEWLAAAPQATVAHEHDRLHGVAQRPRRPAAAPAAPTARSLDLGGNRVRRIDTPHVPHGWEAGVLYEETTGTLFCGDLFTAPRQRSRAHDDDIVGPAIAAEAIFRASCARARHRRRPFARLGDLAPTPSR